MASCDALDSPRNFLALDVGAYVTNLEQRFSVPESYRGQVSSLAALARFRSGFFLGEDFTFEPSIAAVLPWRSGADGSTKIFTFQGNGDLGFRLLRGIKLRGGPGLQWNYFVSEAETVRLNNGTSTSDFYIPARAVSFLLVTVQMGIEFLLSHRFSLSADVIVSDVASGSRRRAHGVLALGLVL